MLPGGEVFRVCFMEVLIMEFQLLINGGNFSFVGPDGVGMISHASPIKHPLKAGTRYEYRAHPPLLKRGAKGLLLGWVFVRQFLETNEVSFTPATSFYCSEGSPNTFQHRTKQKIKIYVLHEDLIPA